MLIDGNAKRLCHAIRRDIVMGRPYTTRGEQIICLAAQTIDSSDHLRLVVVLRLARLIG